MVEYGFATNKNICRTQNLQREVMNGREKVAENERSFINGISL